MTVASSLAKAGPYACNGSNKVFDYAFKALDASHIKVYVTPPGGTPTLVTTDFSVSGVGSDGGGTVTYPVSAAALSAGNTVTIQRELPLTQAVDLENGGAFFAETHERAFDSMTMMIQQVAEKVARSLVFPVGTGQQPDTLLSALAATGQRRYLAWKADNSGMEFVPLTASDVASGTAERWATPRTLALTGTVIGAVEIDGSTDETITTDIPILTTAIGAGQIGVSAVGWSGNARSCLSPGRGFVLATSNFPTNGGGEYYFLVVDASSLGWIKQTATHYTSGRVYTCSYNKDLPAWTAWREVAARGFLAQAWKTVNQSIAPNTDTKLSWGAKAVDPDACFDTANSRYVVKEAGTHLVALSVASGVSATACSAYLRIRLNGATYRQTAVPVPVGGGANLDLCKPVWAAAGDTIEAAIEFAGASGNIDIPASLSQTSMEVLRI